MNVYSKQFSPILEAIAAALDIPESYFEIAVKRYESIGEWFERDGSIVAQYNPLIYPQGSFLLGTVTKPISDKQEYDLDLVSELSLEKDFITQETLKNLVGHEIKSYADAKSMKSPVEEGRRCWTLHYADGVQFHIDILPAIPDAEKFKQFIESRGIPSSSWSDLAIAITDNTLPNYNQIDSEWPRSNPKGYAEWFSSRMQTRFDAIRKSLMEKQIDEVPEYKIKTPLQQSNQILKRHRDVWFEKNKSRYDEKAKPISIIIATLSALAYNNEADLQQALWNIVSNMHKHIERDIRGAACIPNPVNPFENFADKWQEYPVREACFKDWLEQVKDDLKKAFELSDIQSVGESLKHCLGERVTNDALKKLSGSETVYVSTLSASIKPTKQYADEKTLGTVISAMKITDDEVKWLKLNFPTLQYELSLSKITGELRFCAAYDNEAGNLEIGEHAGEMNHFVRDAFEIEICLNNLDRNGWPKVYEIGGKHYRISRKYNVPIIDLHFYPDDDSCCLGLKYGGNRNLRIKRFLIELVIPFFYQLSYTAKFGIEASSKDLWGAYSHGEQGHIEYLDDIMKIAKCRPSRNSLCPCGSGKKYKKCHMDAVDFLNRAKNATSDVSLV